MNSLYGGLLQVFTYCSYGQIFYRMWKREKKIRVWKKYVICILCAKQSHTIIQMDLSYKTKAWHF